MAPRSPWPPSFVLPLPSPILPAPASAAVGRAGETRPRNGFLPGLPNKRPGSRARRSGRDYRNPAGGICAVLAEIVLARSAAAGVCLHDLARRRQPSAGPRAEGASLVAGLPCQVRRASSRRKATSRRSGDGGVDRAGGDLPLVQWQIRSPQAFTVTAVTGASVQRWSQDGERVLVSLDPPIKGEGADGVAATVQLTGWFSLSGAPDAMRLELPCFQLASTQTQDTTVRLIAGNEVSLSEVGVHNLTPVNPAAGDRTYTAGGRTDYGGTWQTHTGHGEAHIVTVAGMRDRKLTFTAVVDCRPAHGKVESLAVRVRNWTGRSAWTRRRRCIRPSNGAGRTTACGCWSKRRPRKIRCASRWSANSRPRRRAAL